MRATCLSVMLLALVARAEGSVLTTHGRVLPGLELGVWGGSRTVGLGVVKADEGASAAVAGELVYAYRDHTLEARGSRVWQVTASRFATASVNVGGAWHIVPERFDMGVGPHVGLTLGLGGEVVSVDFGLQSGVELFFRDVLVRLPERGVLGIRFKLGAWAVTAQAAVGADIVPTTGAVVGRGEVLLSLAWFHQPTPNSPAHSN